MPDAGSLSRPAALSLLDTDLDPEQRDYAEVVHGSGQTLLAILNDILDFSKIEDRGRPADSGGR